MLVFYWLLFAAASAAIIDVWFKGSIFQNLRDAVQAKLDAHLLDDTVHKYQSEAEAMEATNVVVTNVKPGWPHNFVNRLHPLVLKLLVCPFCMAYHVPAYLMLFFAGPAALLLAANYTTLAGIVFSPIAVLATTFTLNKLRDLSYRQPPT